ncbi:MAG: cobalamin biosynthesis protein CbiX [Firmicutes bacterium]|nr:cobalamin biosynthesis protein CbiX [Bacillota bacterium]
MNKAVLIVGHGSRSDKAQETFNQVVEMVKKRLDCLVKGAHMESCKPSIPEVVKEIVNEDVKEIKVIPYFLYEGIHIKEDIPEILKELSDKYKDVEFKLGKPIGVEALLADILVKRALNI